MIYRGLQRKEAPMARKKRGEAQRPASPARSPRSGKLEGFSDAELLAELARRRVVGAVTDLTAMELAAEKAKFQFGHESLEAMLAMLPPEDGSPKPCPKCGEAVPVRALGRPREIHTLSGWVTLNRNYHHCDQCRLGFYPRDIELGLPGQGEVSFELERRILDLGVTDTFANAAERWSVHYPEPISENLVRRVVDRVGKLCASAGEAEVQRACQPPPKKPAGFLVVATDGSLVQTREADPWKEAKVAVVARGDQIKDGPRKRVEQARYVSTLQKRDGFAKTLKEVLEVERADEVPKVVWLGDGAPSNWTIAEELCPFAIQILDRPHAVQHAMDCGRKLLGEGAPLLREWELRIQGLIDEGPERLIEELMDCVPETDDDDQLDALEDAVRYFRTNEKRMRYAEFRDNYLPIGSGIVESAHRHVLQVRMKRAGQRWSLERAERMARLRAAYSMAGPARFHRAVREAYARTPTYRLRSI